MAIFSRFRSKERDVYSDTKRLVPIIDALRAAIRQAETEFAGLRARLQETGDRAAFLLGDGVESDTTGDTSSEAALKEAEGFLVRGEMRSRYLAKQISTLNEIGELLSAVVKPETPPANRR
jgi:hypothetical protein